MPSSVDTNVVVLPNGQTLQEGVSIVAGEVLGVSDIYAAQSHIQWLKQSDGSLVAQIFASTDVNPGQGNRILAEQVFAADDTNTNSGLSRAVFQAASAVPGNQVAGITATQQGGGATKKVEVTIAGLNPLLLSDAANQSSFVQDGNATLRNISIHGQYSVPFNIAAGGGATTNVNTGFTLGATWIPFGAPNYGPPVVWQDAISWAYSFINATTVQIALHNNGAASAVGTFNFFILNVA